MEQSSFFFNASLCPKDTGGMVTVFNLIRLLQKGVANSADSDQFFMASFLSLYPFNIDI